ncbi:MULTISPECIES: glycine cleavage system protein GcvH [unclassified Candidatus Frackibacter]|jgi:glycine cleavage system H protein|uniref:glycine cleavage system protein GcvH n=1 Tax=unclassified Candidatus Frackibacter TaxID=2648818 RepID=UPI0008807C35|nr:MULTISPECIES: glycine cleavage system protein GcvH [unclassified Candidatus Frackibacter]SDC36818.1 glycine cleavage system H protein [Candidatus Frackibacter sp. WG11]SEM63124.1 glycine cleavage system H protein [Candidatus Frackibacter sp. WG12]SFL64560.1 glycine cleavage system H protein [Candidatus Frackibacter sp. WG13]
MEILEGLYYSEDHEWVRVEGDKVYVGIADYAQNALGDIVFVEFPMEGEEYEAEESVGVIESVKAVADLYTPVSGEVLEINEDLYDNPQKLNEAPYENWMIAVKLADEEELDDLMTAEEYKKFCEEEEE